MSIITYLRARALTKMHLVIPFFVIFRSGPRGPRHLLFLPVTKAEHSLLPPFLHTPQNIQSVPTCPLTLVDQVLHS
jgi:hypothetical protein